MYNLSSFIFCFVDYGGRDTYEVAFVFFNQRLELRTRVECGLSIVLYMQFAIDEVEMVLVANKTDMEEHGLRTVRTSKGKQVLMP